VVSQLRPSLWAVLIPLFFFLINMGFVGPNTVAAALEHEGHRAGLASSLLGSLQWSLAFFASLLVGLLHNQTSLPMVGLIAFFGWFALGVYFLLVRAEAGRSGLK
jgi:DHA1 family bicyclomycin/chloramphenicol resistance-like MFS transporter